MPKDGKHYSDLRDACLRRAAILESQAREWRVRADGWEAFRRAWLKRLPDASKQTVFISGISQTKGVA